MGREVVLVEEGGFTRITLHHARTQSGPSGLFWGLLDPRPNQKCGGVEGETARGLLSKESYRGLQLTGKKELIWGVKVPRSKYVQKKILSEHTTSPTMGILKKKKKFEGNRKEKKGITRG